ncbi:endospore germination permease [Bacillus mesophilum]|uniref:GerAB/ArcD/ProY family transporter n=1 Tax=Bacillus mesophilum TaxID=1071718 RepID=A0A7V7RSN3_9BACI|nr:endospore germination permease [Bacillus mesophilum]KAB2335932.1 GerAB/ArcD/ProY family transporter [Bacillus mesophilum]
MQNLIKVLIPRQILLLLILSTGLLNHVILIPNLLSASGRDSWISVIVAYPISILFLLLVHYIVKNTPSNGFFSYISEQIGKPFSIFLSIPVIVYLLISSFITLQDFIIWLNVYFLADSSLFMITSVLILACFLFTFVGIKQMAISSGFLLPFVMLLGIMIALINTDIKDPSLLFPVLSNGLTPILKGVVYSLAGLLEIYLIILLLPFSQEPIRFRHLFILLTLLTGLTLGPLTASIMEFGPTEAENYQYPAYEQWRVLNIGEFINHLDFFALFQWLSGAVIRVGLLMYLLGLFISNNLNHYRLNNKLVAFIYSILFCLLVFIKVDSQVINNFIYTYFLPACCIFFAIYILVSSMLIFVLKKRGEHFDKINKHQTNRT